MIPNANVKVLADVFETLQRENRQRNGHNSGFPADFADEPLSLFRDVPAGDAFPVDALGPVLGGMARALHESAVQSPLAICGTAVLSAACLATQGHRDVELPYAGGHVKPISLFFLAIAKSGERKSATDAMALKPVQKHTADLREAYEKDINAHRNNLDVWTSDRQAILRKKDANANERQKQLNDLGPEPRGPKKPALTVSEPTIEGLNRYLTTAQPSLGLITSEGAQFIGGHAMSDDAKRRSAAALNCLWDEGRSERMRASEEASILTGRRLTVFLQAQPDVAHTFLSDPILDDIGLLARFLITQPESTMGFRKVRDLPLAHKTAIATYGAKLLSILRTPLPYAEDGQSLDPKPLVMSDDAKGTWDNFCDHVENMLAPGKPLSEISGFGNKLPEHAARIAAVLQIFDDPKAEELEEDFLGRGIELATFYANEAIRLSNSARINAELREAQKLLAWLEKWPETYITIGVIQQRGPASIREKAKAERMVAILVDHGWLAAAPDGVLVEGKPRRLAYRIWGRQ